MNPTFNISGLHRVTVINPTEQAPLRHLSGGKFRMSEDFFAKNNMHLHGLAMHLDTQNGTVYLSAQADNDSDFFKRRAGAENKSREFTARALAMQLGAGEKQDFDLTLVHEDTQDGRRYFRVEASKEDQADEEPRGTTSAPVVEDAPQADARPAVAEPAIAEGPAVRPTAGAPLVSVSAESDLPL